MHGHIFAYSSPPPAGPSISPAPPDLGCSVRLTRVAGGGFKKMIKKLKCDRAHLRDQSYERTPATRSFFRIPPAPLRRGRGVPWAKHPGHGPRNRGVALDLTRLVKKEQTREKGITTTFENNGLDSPSTGVFWHVAPNERRQG